MSGCGQTWVVTNNPDIKFSQGRLLFVPGGPLQVFKEARKLIFQGWLLLSHPLMGSLKPWQNPYRSLALLEPRPRQGILDTKSIILMERAIDMLDKRLREVGSRLDYDVHTLAHFRRLDWELISQTIELSDQAEGVEVANFMSGKERRKVNKGVDSCEHHGS